MIEIIKQDGGGGGIESLNGLTATDQFLAVGTSGTDFAISSSVDTSTFNLPTASAINRGALSAANWSTFNGKQDALVSGTNIKTINSTSILGSGNLVVAATPSGVSGAVQFSDGSALASDATNFFYDNTNDRLGLGINAPTSRLHIKGTGATNATKSIFIQNSALTETFSISDSGIGLISNSLGINGGVGGSTYLGQTMSLAVNEYSRLGNIRIGGGVGTGVFAYIQTDVGNTIEFATNKIFFCNSWIVSSNNYKLGTVTTFGRLQINTLDPATAAIVLQAQAVQTEVLQDHRNSANVRMSAIAAKGEFYFGSGTVSASAAIQADSTTQGFLPPRMTNAQRAAIVSPAEGLLVHNTTNKGTAYYDGTNWGYLNGAAQTIAGSGGTVNIPFASGNIVNLTLTASTTLTLSGHVVGVYILKVIQGGSGSYTLTYPASVKWSGGSAPTLTTTVGKTDIITLFHDGTDFFGTYSLNY
jgi:hypothetical protein